MEIQQDNRPLYISEDEVKKLLSWPLIFEACVQALRSVSKGKTSENQPSAIQPARQRIVRDNESGCDEDKFMVVAYTDDIVKCSRCRFFNVGRNKQLQTAVN